jgi:ribosomal protein L7/L12
MDEQIKLLLRQDKILYAVNLVRQQKGWGLRQAKEYVDAIERNMKRKGNYRKIPPPPSEIASEVRTLLRWGHKDKAIELLRQKTVMRRKEARAYIESLSLIDSIRKQSRQDSLSFGGGFQQNTAQAGHNYQDKEALEGKARQILQVEGKVEAIKFVRQATKMGLREAKELVDNLALGSSSDNVLDERGRNKVSPEELEGKARQLLAKGRKFDAIKFVRQAGAMGLREAKEYVEAL